MKLLLLGKDGQVGRELQRSLAPLGRVLACGREQADLTDLSGLASLVRDAAPDVIVNAAAYTAVDRAEAEPELADRVNAEAVGLLAEATRRSGILLVHYSTDYVFDGLGTHYHSEEDETGPLNRYGASKLAGERAITQSDCRHLVFRTSWVFSASGSNFATTMLKLGLERDSLRVVGDQVGAPTSAELVADVTALALYRMKVDREFGASADGLFHLAAAGETSWWEYARFLLFEAAQRGARPSVGFDRIESISSQEYAAPAVRPLNSRLNCAKLERTFGVTLPAWQVHVRRLVWQWLSGTKS